MVDYQLILPKDKMMKRLWRNQVVEGTDDIRLRFGRPIADIVRVTKSFT